MRYRKMGNTQVDVSILGFGAMRLPMLGAHGPGDSFNPNIPINEVEAVQMVEFAVDQGVNYFDTAYAYHGGQSETFLGKALKNHRSKVLIATKLPVWNIEKNEDFDRIFNEQLAKLGVDYVDFYLVHGLDEANWNKMKDKGALEFLDRLKKDGRIRFAAFSFHDSLKTFKNIVDAYDWSMCQIQYNFYDQVYQAGKEGLDYAAARGLGIVVMEPLRGGKLVDKIPPAVQAIWDEAPVKRSPAEWGMRWVWNHEAVSTVLTGSSSLAQFMENTHVANEASAGSLSSEELVLLDRVRDTYRKLLKVDCTGCGYCMPCPSGVNIPTNFSFYNDSYLFDDMVFGKQFYNTFLTPAQRASGCTECFACEQICPQHLKIVDELKEVHKRLGGQ
jgi:uncharacterized protein